MTQLSVVLLLKVLSVLDFAPLVFLYAMYSLFFKSIKPTKTIAVVGFQTIYFPLFEKQVFLYISHCLATYD